MEKLHEGGLCPVITLDHLDLLTSEVGGFLFVDLGKAGSVEGRSALMVLQDLWMIGAVDNTRSTLMRNPVESPDMRERFKERARTPRRILFTAKVTAFGRLLMELDV